MTENQDFFMDMKNDDKQAPLISPGSDENGQQEPKIIEEQTPQTENIHKDPAEDAENKHIIEESHDKILQDLENKNSGTKCYRESKWRWVGLFLLCLITVAIYAIYAIPQSIEIHVQDKFGISTVMFSLSNSTIYLPAIMFCVLAGILIKKYGSKNCSYVFCALIFIGQTLDVFGVWILNYYVFILGRLLIGLGLENLWMILTLFIADWFAEHERSFAMSWFCLGDNIGFLLPTYLCPRLFSLRSSLVSSFGTFWVFFVVSLLGYLVFLWMDMKSQISDKERGIVKVAEKSDREGFQFSNIIKLNSSYWCFNAFGCMLYGVFYGFSTFQNTLLMTFYGLSNKEASNALSIYYVVNVIVTPVAGMIIDKVGYQKLFMIGVSILLIGMNLLFIFTAGSFHGLYIALVPLMILAILFAFFVGCYWAIITELVPEETKGTSLGIVASLWSLSVTIFPILTGYIIDLGGGDLKGYIYACYFFLICSVLCLIFIIIFSFIYKKSGTINTDIKHKIASFKVSTLSQALLTASVKN